MAGKQAKMLSNVEVSDLLVFASCTRHPIRNRLIVLLSAKAGLRACEIANVTWDMVVDGSGQISGLIELHDDAAKKGSGRLIPVHPDLGSRETLKGEGFQSDHSMPRVTAQCARRQRRVFTEAFASRQGDGSMMQTQVLLRGGDNATISVQIRLLRAI